MMPTDRPLLPRLLVIAMLLALFGYPLLLGAPLCDPDEGIHAAIAQEMVERNDWITPRLLGEPFRDKPILYFWMQAASLATFGMSEAAVRLPGMLLAAAGVLSTGLVGARIFGGTTGLVASVIYGTMILPTALAQLPVHDVALVPCANLAILGLWQAQHASGWRRLLPAVGTGVMLGLAALAKGLPGIAVTGVAFASYLCIDLAPSAIRVVRGAATAGDRDRLVALAPIIATGLLALFVALVIATPWYLAAERRDPGYLRYFFHDRHVQGFVTATQSHGGRPVWYYLPFLLVGGLPAILYLPAMARDWWCRGGVDRGTILMLAWLVGGMLFFSAASSKLPTYIWPVLPPLAVLAALPWSRLLAGTLSDAARRMLSAMLHLSCPAAALVLPAAAVGCRMFADVRISWYGWAIIIAVAPLFLVSLWFWRARRHAESLAAGAVATVVQFMVFITFVLTPLLARFSGRDLASHFNTVGRVPDPVIMLDNRGFSTVFYLAPSLRSGLHRGQFAVWLSRDVGRWPDAADDAVVAVSDGVWAKASRRVSVNENAGTRVGHWRLIPPSALSGLGRP